MGLLFDRNQDAAFWQLGKEAAADPEMCSTLAGRLYLSASGWALLSVPNSFGRGAFDMLQEPGTELPEGLNGSPFSCHISVMTKSEIDSIGGGAELNERGRLYRFRLGPVYSVNPSGWPDMEQAWFFRVFSKELEELRVSKGLPPQPKHPFHLTFACRKKGVLSGGKTKAGEARDGENDWETPCECSHESIEKQAYPAVDMRLPDRSDLGDLSKIKPGMLLDIIRQIHDSQKSGLHDDWRIGSPELNLYSWATKKELPQPGERPRGMYQQPLHSYSYGNFQGTLAGAGAGTVKLHSRGKVQVDKVSPGALHFTRTDGEIPQNYALIRPKNAKRPGDWLIINTTPASQPEPEKTAALTTQQLAEARKTVNPSPTEAQIAAGNYAKGHVSWNGFGITIENPKGSTRSGKSRDGKSWSVTMANDYGYFKGIRGRDKDHLDVFIGPHLESELIHVINQNDPATQEFDEHKVVIGCLSEDAAKEVYLANYAKDWKGLGSVKSMTLDAFTDWTADGKVTKKAEEKLAEMPFWRRAIAAQVYAPTWDKQKSFLQNILGNIRSAKENGQRFVREQDNWRTFNAQLNPVAGLQQHLNYLQSGEDPVVHDPIDFALFRSHLLG